MDDNINLFLSKSPAVINGAVQKISSSATALNMDTVSSGEEEDGEDGEIHDDDGGFSQPQQLSVFVKQQLMKKADSNS